MSDRDRTTLPEGDFVSAPVDDIWNLERFIAWLEMMPAEGGYDPYCTTGACLLDQYAGSKLAFMQAPGLFAITIAFGFPRTFGGALSRARSAARALA